MSARSLVHAAALLAVFAGTGPAFAQGTESGPNAELVALFNSICDRGAEPGADFRAVAADAFPEDLPAFYLGPTEGLYWYRSGPIPAYVARTRGPGHWGGTEEDCMVAVRGAQFETVAASLARRMGDRSAFGKRGRLGTWDRGETTNVNLSDRRNRKSVFVTKRPDGLVRLLAPVIPGVSLNR